MEMLSMIFPNCLLHIVGGFSFLVTENNLQADVSKGKCYPHSVIFLGIGNIVRLGVLLLRLRVYTHVGFTSESQATPCLST